MALKLKGSTSGFVGLDAPYVAGNNTLILPTSAGSAHQILANDITAGVTTFTQVTVSRNGDLTVPGTISIGGTLTYEDVTSVDSVGIVTARSGVRINGGGLTIIGNTTGLNAGVSTFTADISVNSVSIGKGANSVANNTAIGVGALDGSVTGDHNTAIGKDALSANTSGANNNAVGSGSLTVNSTGSQNNVVGVDALKSNTTGNSQNAFGYESLMSLTTAGGGTAFGHKAGRAAQVNICAMGAESAFKTTTGTFNSAFGNYSLSENTIGSKNTACLLYTSPSPRDS